MMTDGGLSEYQLGVEKVSAASLCTTLTVTILSVTGLCDDSEISVRALRTSFFLVQISSLFFLFFLGEGVAKPESHLSYEVRCFLWFLVEAPQLLSQSPKTSFFVLCLRYYLGHVFPKRKVLVGPKVLPQSPKANSFLFFKNYFSHVFSRQKG